MNLLVNATARSPECWSTWKGNINVRREYLGAAFREMHDRFGPIADYFAVGSGINRAGQEALCARFLEC